jgi:predicted enzyme related to lactoylglutathione lyase
MSAPNTAGAVVYAKDVSRVTAFYREVTGFPVTHSEIDYAILESETFQLVVHAIPAGVAASIYVANPPLRREDAAVKLIFPVPSITASRALAAAHGGALNPPEREWRFGGCRVCDGHDPEGNVLQLREIVR